MFYLNEQHSLAIKEKHKWNSSQCTSCGKCEVSIPLPPSSSFDVVVTQPLRNPTTRPRSQAASRRASRAVSMEASMEASMAATGPARDAPSPTAPPTRRATRPPGASPPGPSHSIPQGMPKTSLYGRKTSWPMWRRYKIETVRERERPLPIIWFLVMKACVTHHSRWPILNWIPCSGKGILAFLTVLLLGQSHKLKDKQGVL